MIIKESIYFAPAGEERTLHIYLPDNYGNSDERYPVMYFWDGHNLFNDEDATYGKSWGLKEFMDGWCKNMIIVGLECSHTGNNRLDEYCPYEGEILGHRIRPAGKETMDWVVGTLKPYVDGRFRTYTNRACTAVGGSSMGGLMSLYAVTMYNEVFSKAACVSPSIFMVGGTLAADIEACRIDPDTRIYLSWGECEGGEPNSGFSRVLAGLNRAMQALLNRKGALTRLYCQPDGGHCEADWEKQVPDFMKFLWLE